MIRNAKLSYQVTKNVAIYALSSGKFLDDRKYACVKDLTNIMSVGIGNMHYYMPRNHNDCHSTFNPS